MISRKRLGTTLALAGVTISVAAVVPLVASQAATTSTAVTVSTTAVRTFLDADGNSTTADTRHVSMTVDQTTNLRGRQEIQVTWKGAHPTGGLVADVNSGDGAQEEYPFVLLECRGLDSTKVPLSKQIRPETCWTQTAGERFQKDNNTGYPAWRSDRYATAEQRSAAVEAPDPRPAACFHAGLAERWVPFDAADGTVYPGGSLGCAGMAPESANVEGAGLPSNTTYGITASDGTGSASFDVWTADENASLGCSSTVPCSLVAVPVVGTSCDAYGTLLPADQRAPARRTAAADAACRASGQYAAGQVRQNGIDSDLSVSGALWWSASNWRNRLTVPLGFATPASLCDVVNAAQPLNIYGSVLMNEATAQWEPAFCTDRSLFPFIHVQTADSAARSLLASGNIDAAFTSRAPDGGFSRPAVQAPVAVSGFAVSYLVDDAQGRRYESLRLDARLLAKLLTESYSTNPLVQSYYPAIASNPGNITLDPEFQALNPGLPKYAVKEAASTVIALSTESDLIYALTSYINADREAREWLDGAPDPWGMTVNPNYKGIELPVESWPLLDNFQLPQSYIDAGINPCYSYSPSPYLALVANPTAQMSSIVQDVQFGISNVNITCTGTPDDVSSLRLRVQGRQQPGFRFVLGITALSAVNRYGLTAAALQTSSSVPAGATFTDATGRTFASPDNTGLKAAAALLKPDESTRSWTLSYTDLQSAAGVSAYPGTMPIYADVPTSGLSAQSAGRLATLLRYAAGRGQQPGIGNGDLPPGYLPLTAANGLAAQRDYTLRAADAVAAQDGTVPDLKAPVVTSTSSAPAGASDSSGVTSASASGGSSSTVVRSSAPRGAVSTPAPRVSSAPLPVITPAHGSSSTGTRIISSGRASVATSASQSAAATPNATPAPSAVAQVRTAGVSSNLAAWALPVLLALGLVTGAAGVLLRYPSAAPGAIGLVRRLRRPARHGTTS